MKLKLFIRQWSPFGVKMMFDGEIGEGVRFCHTDLANRRKNSPKSLKGDGEYATIGIEKYKKGNNYVYQKIYRRPCVLSYGIGRFGSHYDPTGHYQSGKPIG